jgi:hypothetical protein
LSDFPLELVIVAKDASRKLRHGYLDQTNRTDERTAPSGVQIARDAAQQSNRCAMRRRGQQGARCLRMRRYVGWLGEWKVETPSALFSL